MLEPISLLEVTVPAAYQGDVMGDLNARRGRVQGTESVGDGEQEITALVPTSEIMRYAIDLRSMTGGRGRFTAEHDHYDVAAGPPRRQGQGHARSGQDRMTGSSPQDVAVAFRSFPRRLTSILAGAEDDAHRTSAGPLVQQLDGVIRGAARAIGAPSTGDLPGVAAGLADAVDNKPAKEWTDELLAEVRDAALEGGRLLRLIENKVTE